MLPWLWGRRLGLCNMEQHIVFLNFPFICLYISVNKLAYIHKLDHNWDCLFSLRHLSLHMYFHYQILSQIYIYIYMCVMIIPHSSCKYIWIHHPWGFYNYFSFTFIIYSQTISEQILHTMMCSTLQQLIHVPCFKVFIK